MNLPDHTSYLFQVIFISSTFLSISGCSGSVPDTPEIKLQRAVMLMERGQGAEAVPLLDQAIEAMPGHADARFQRGLVYENLQLPDKAIADYDACLKLDKLHTGAMNNRAVQLAKLKRHDEAIAAFTELIDLAPEDFLGYRNRALARFDLSDNVEALQDYEKALKLNPEDASSWYQRGNVYLAMNSPEKAESDYSRAIELDPKFAKAWMNRGVARYRQDKLNLAAEDLAESQKLDNNIVIPSIDFFTAARHTAAVTETLPATSWESTRSSATRELAARGFEELDFLQEFPDLRCAKLAGKINGESRIIFVTTTKDKGPITLPCIDPVDSEDGNAEPCSLLVLQSSDENGDDLRVVRFEMSWQPHADSAEPMIMRYHL